MHTTERENAGRKEADLSISVMQQAILDLPQKYREVIALRYYDSLPYERIATVLGLTVQGVNGRLIRAKRKIEQHLRRQGFTGGDYENA
jgi:RNA polymerase sigma factor (sigma-70 family)